MAQQTWHAMSAQVMSEVLDGEAVIIDLASGRYHAAAGVGATVWLAVLRGSSLEGILAQVSTHHAGVPDDAGDHIRRFLDELVAAGLAVEESEGQAPPALDGSPVAVTTPWSAPVLESHDDLEDLLLLDPVHEVTEAGWPHAAPPVP